MATVGQSLGSTAICRPRTSREIQQTHGKFQLPSYTFASNDSNKRHEKWMKVKVTTENKCTYFLCANYKLVIRIFLFQPFTNTLRVWGCLGTYGNCRVWRAMPFQSASRTRQMARRSRSSRWTWRSSTLPVSAEETVELSASACKM